MSAIHFTVNLCLFSKYVDMFRLLFFVVLLPYPQERNCQASLPCYFHIRKQLTVTPVYHAISVSTRNHFYTCPRVSIYVSHVAVVASRRKAATKEWRIPSFCVRCGDSRLTEFIPFGTTETSTFH